MALNYYSFQFGSFVFGGAGSPYQILDVEGLGLPELRVQDDNRGYNDGMFSGRDFLSGRTLTFTINIFADATRNAQQNLALFNQAMIPQQSGTTALYFQLAPTDTTKVLYARVRSRRVLVDPEYTYGYIRTQVTMFAPNPKYYDQTSVTGSISPVTPNGRTYNRTYNLSYGGGTNASALTIVNSGTWTTYPTITITGPITNPILTNQTTNQSLAVTVTLLATDSLVLDLENRNVLLNGSPVRNLLTGSSQWFGASPGSTVFALTGTAFTAGVTSASVVYASAYV
jgi:hypothetical protein